MSVKQRNRWESVAILDARINQVIPIPYLVTGGIVLLHCKKAQRTTEYRLTIGTTRIAPVRTSRIYSSGQRSKALGTTASICTTSFVCCASFMWRMTTSFMHRCASICTTSFVHAPTFSFNEVKKVMDRGVGRFLY